MGKVVKGQRKLCVFVDFGMRRKGKKAGPATEDPGDPKKARLSSMSINLIVGNKLLLHKNY